MVLSWPPVCRRSENRPEGNRSNTSVADRTPMSVGIDDLTSSTSAMSRGDEGHGSGKINARTVQPVLAVIWGKIFAPAMPHTAPPGFKMLPADIVNVETLPI
jgi:hypothetical protein